MAVNPNLTTPATLIGQNPCLKCLSDRELKEFELALYARASGLNVADDLDTILEDSACFDCLSDREMREATITSLWNEFANGVSFDTLLDETKCLKCLDPKKVRAAILSLLESALNPVIL